MAHKMNDHAWEFWEQRSVMEVCTRRVWRLAAWVLSKLTGAGGWGWAQFPPPPAKLGFLLRIPLPHGNSLGCCYSNVERGMADPFSLLGSKQMIKTPLPTSEQWALGRVSEQCQFHGTPFRTFPLQHYTPTDRPLWGWILMEFSVWRLQCRNISFTVQILADQHKHSC